MGRRNKKPLLLPELAKTWQEALGGAISAAPLSSCGLCVTLIGRERFLYTACSY
jgi:hypothetical protein